MRTQEGPIGICCKDERCGSNKGKSLKWRRPFEIGNPCRESYTYMYTHELLFFCFLTFVDNWANGSHCLAETVRFSFVAATWHCLGDRVVGNAKWMYVQSTELYTYAQEHVHTYQVHNELYFDQLFESGPRPLHTRPPPRPVLRARTESNSHVVRSDNSNTSQQTRQGVFCIPSRGCCSRLLYEGRKTLEARGKFFSLRKFFRTKWESSSNPSGKVLQTQVGIFFREST